MTHFQGSKERNPTWREVRFLLLVNSNTWMEDVCLENFQASQDQLWPHRALWRLPEKGMQNIYVQANHQYVSKRKNLLHIISF